jgi:hypothetical protein
MVRGIPMLLLFKNGDLKETSSASKPGQAHESSAST